MADLQYDFLNNAFTVFKPVQTPEVKLNMPLLEDYDISDWASGITSTGVPIAKGANSNSPTITFDNPEEYHFEQPSEMKPDLDANKKKAMQFFQSKGLKAHQAAGLVGNLIRESSLNPNAVNSNSKAYGIAQWLGDRKKKLFSKYGNKPTFDQQLEFVWEELNSTHKKGLESLKSSLNAEEAAANAFGWYEFSVGPKGAIQEMKKYGQNGMKSYNQGIKFAKELLV